MTGANDLLLFERAERKLGDAVVAWPRGRRAPTDDRPSAHPVLLRLDDLCPVVRGSGIRSFRYQAEDWVAWCHDDVTAAPREPSARLARHLAPLRGRLRSRPGWRAGLPDGVLFRVDAAMVRPRVAWRDIATDLEVVRLPARKAVLATDRPLVALNTVYFLAAEDDGAAFALTALLASLPARVFARSIAERAKDARFRFFAWTVSGIPLPPRWRVPSILGRLAALGEHAHAVAAEEQRRPAEICEEIDAVTSELFGLSRRATASLRRFDGWLSGADERPAAENRA